MRFRFALSKPDQSELYRDRQLKMSVGPRPPSYGAAVGFIWRVRHNDWFGTQNLANREPVAARTMGEVRAELERQILEALGGESS